MKVPEPRKLSSGTYFIQLRLGGESITVNAATAKSCKRQAELIKAEYLNGKRQHGMSDRSHTLGSCMDAYIKRYSATLSPSTVRGYVNIRNHRFKSWIDMPLDKIKDWQAVIDSELRVFSEKTVKNSWAFASKAMREIADFKIDVKLAKVPVKEIPFLQPEEIPLFLKEIHGKDAEIMALLALHSLRHSEAAGLTWDRVNLKAKTIYVHGARVYDADGKLVQKQTNKNASSTRTVPIMIPQLYDALIAESDKTGYVVKLSKSSIHRQITSACERAGVTVVSCHGLRHSFASLGASLGMTEDELMDLGGWSDIGTMKRIYTRVTQSAKHRAVNKMSEYYSTHST